ASSTDFWIPLQNRPELTAWDEEPSLDTLYGTPKWWCIQLIGRLVPGVTESQALAKLDPVFQSAALIGLGTPDPKAKKNILAFSWMFAISGSQALAAWSGMEIPFVLDSRVLLFTLAISISCAIIFGLAPLRRAVSVPVGVTLKTSNATAYRDQRSSWSGRVVV